MQADTGHRELIEKKINWVMWAGGQTYSKWFARLTEGGWDMYVLERERAHVTKIEGKENQTTDLHLEKLLELRK